MKALILAAGYGTRLYPLTLNQPKPLLDLNQRTIIDFLLDKIQDDPELSEILVVTNDKFTGHFVSWAEKKKGLDRPIKVINDKTTSNEDRLGSVGDIDYAIRQESINEDILVLGGDNLFDYDLEGYLRFAREKAPHVTIGLYDIKDKDKARPFGVAALDKECRITSFDEKPERPKSALIAMCLYYFPGDTLPMVGEYLARSQKKDKAGDYIRWISGREPVFGFQFEGHWFDIGSKDSYQQAQEHFRKQKEGN